MSKSNYHITKCLWPSQIIQTKPYLSSGQFLQLSVDLECLARCFFSQTMWMHLLKMTKIKSKNQLLTLSNYSATLAFLFGFWHICTSSSLASLLKELQWKLEWHTLKVFCMQTSIGWKTVNKNQKKPQKIIKTWCRWLKREVPSSFPKIWINSAKQYSRHLVRK